MVHERQSPGLADFDAFYRAEQPRMVALAIGLTGVPEAARDLAQESLLKAYRAWDSVSVLDRPGAWVRRVTINASMSWHRSNRRESEARARLGGEPSTMLPESESDHFWSVVRGLPERQRAVIALYYLDDRSIADVAASLDIAEGTVKATLYQARATLAAALGVRHGPEEA